jgi:dihydrofolate synthase/folylpolyglutamate synthase
MSEHLIDEYSEALAFLLGRVNYEQEVQIPALANAYELERMQELLDRLGNPQAGLPIIHLAGTKGKGSTAAMLSSIACSSGYRVGLYTSPHLDRLEERFVINNEPCTRAELVEMVALLRPVVEAMDAEQAPRNLAGGLTYFEVTTALALLYFARRNLDLAILEVGMGGRLDSTNVCQPVVTAITSISLDHTHQLGETLAEIASEKAGIIKQGIPIVSGVVEESARNVIRQRAREQRAPLVERGQDFDFCYQRSVAVRAEPAHFSSLAKSAMLNSRENLQLGLCGEHQAANAAVALAVIDVLGSRGWKFEEAAIRRGLACTRCRGRVEVLQHEPLTVIDAAHNVASVRAFLAALTDFGLSNPRSLVFATTLEKDVPGMMRLLLPQFDHLVFTRYLNNPRAVPPEQLASVATQLGGVPLQGNSPGWQVCDSPQAALAAVQSRFHGKGAVCVTGSFFIAAEMRRLMLETSRRAAVENRAEIAAH